MIVAKLINHVMRRGKKSVAQKVVYQAFDLIQKETQKDPLMVFDEAIRNSAPLLEVRSKRVGGATYQVPVEVKGDKKNSLAMRWILNAARSKKGKPMHEKLAEEIERWCRDRGIEVEMQPSMIPRSSRFSTTALVLGGDGFITKNSLSLAKKRMPFLGINFGTVGFLARAEPSNWEEALEKILGGRFTVERKKILKGSVETCKDREDFEAVNDVVLFRGLQKFMRMRIAVDDHVMYENIGGDGVIVASAVGSTAYNLAADGPISEVGLIVRPLAIHRIDVAPLVLKDDRVVEVTCLDGGKGLREEFVLEIDGDNSRRVRPGDKITVSYAKFYTRFIVPEGSIFFQSLQRKLGLSH
jgi:ribosomal protein S7